MCTLEFWTSDYSSLQLKPVFIWNTICQRVGKYVLLSFARRHPAKCSSRRSCVPCFGRSRRTMPPVLRCTPLVSIHLVQYNGLPLNRTTLFVLRIRTSPIKLHNYNAKRGRQYESKIPSKRSFGSHKKGMHVYFDSSVEIRCKFTLIYFWTKQFVNYNYAE